MEASSGAPLEHLAGATASANIWGPSWHPPHAAARKQAPGQRAALGRPVFTQKIQLDWAKGDARICNKTALIFKEHKHHVFLLIKLFQG